MSAIHDLHILAQGISTFCDLLHIAEAVPPVIDPARQENEKWTHRAHLINRIFLLGCDVAQIESQATGASTDTLLKEKAAELASRFVNIPLSFIHRMKAEHKEPAISINMLTALLDFTKTVQQISSLEFHNLAELPPEQLAKIRFMDSESGQYYTLSKEDCQSLENLQGILGDACATLSAGLENGPARMHFSERRTRVAIADPEREAPPPPPPSTRERVSTTLDRWQELLEQEDRWHRDPAALPFIPIRFHEEAFFKANTCPISLYPIRDPIADPTTRIVYERVCLETWVRLQGTSPISRQPLQLDQLEEKPILKSAITMKLQSLLEEEQDFREQTQNLCAPNERLRFRTQITERIEQLLTENGEHAV